MNTMNQYPTLPATARLAINRCNLPARILGSLAFQQAPQALVIDGIRELHPALFQQLDTLPDPERRAIHFQEYMRCSFLLDYPDQAGFNPLGQHRRVRADYLRLLRGWMFDSGSQEGAVMKGWVESRFGLLPRFHQQVISGPDTEAYMEYLTRRMAGLYNTNSLEAQLDLLFSWCQYELQRRYPQQSHHTLFRGVNHLGGHDWYPAPHSQSGWLLLNNLNSFAGEPESAQAFGDDVLEVRIPHPKVVYFPGLLPGLLAGENEWLVIGGLYEIKRYCCR